MRRISKKNVTSEYLFESEDGMRFPFEGQAAEHDIKLAEKQLEALKRGDINIPEFNLVGNIYKATSDEELDLIEKYCDLKDMSISVNSLPSLVIITDSFAVSVEELKKLSKQIGSL